MVRRDAQSGKPVAQHVTMRDQTGRIYISHTLTATARKYWESKRTRIRHPVGWRIEIPDLDADLTFEPIADDQEIAVFALMRAIWEGAGRITGTVNGRAVTGRARGEFQGYGYIFDFSRLPQSIRHKSRPSHRSVLSSGHR